MGWFAGSPRENPGKEETAGLSPGGLSLAATSIG
jgi:hypothetical protein